MTIMERLAFGAVALGGIGLLVSMFMGVGDILGTLAGAPLAGAREMTESTMVLIVFGGLAFAQIRNRHIRVELFYVRAGPRLRSAMDIVASASAILFFSLLIWQGINEAIYSWQIREATFGLIRFPLYPARTLLVVGTGLMIAQLVIDLWRDIRNFGNPREIEFA